MVDPRMFGELRYVSMTLGHPLFLSIRTLIIISQELAFLFIKSIAVDDNNVGAICCCCYFRCHLSF